MAQQSRDAVVGQTLMVPVAHPVLRDITDDCISAFRRARAEYLSVMEDHRKAGSTTKPVTLKSSIQASLLAELVSLGGFDGVSDVTALTDEAIHV